MQINRLRLLGFKSFVEPTELHIEKGLTGVVGPNGCGKSNLLEALRWVMGETSHKSMRAAAMDDVIFSGTTTRPARNTAEVTIFLDNAARTAPAEWNDNDVVEITRRIEREAGSAYRINGQEVRARDVKILFEDAATGARSPALVRQGQIGEIVNAKPEQRRRILEDAAGVAGLHSRRHDAELRLKAAEGNLARLGDILGQLGSQIESLKRQARQARRYKELSVEIRKAEAVALHVAWTDAEADVATHEAGLAAALSALGAAVEAESRLTREEARLAETMQPLRDEEATRGAVLARLKIEQSNFEKEAERAALRQKELEQRAGQLEADMARERALIEEATDTLSRLDDELMVLTGTDEDALAAEDQAIADLEAARTAETAAAARLADVTRRDFEIRARHKSMEASLAERRDQAAKIERQIAALDTQLREIAARAPDAKKLTALQDEAAELALAVEDAETRAIAAEERVAAAGGQARLDRETLQQANLELRGIESEASALSKMLVPAGAEEHTPVLEALTVAPGYEAALGAALGDDLDASTDAAAPAHWRFLATHDADPRLPAGAEPLIAKVQGPAELTRRLGQIGVVARADGARLQAALAPGQRLVSLDGDLWRWDGFVAAAEAPTAAAQRLAQKNRLAEIERWQVEFKIAADAAVEADRVAQAELVAADTESRAARQAQRDLLAAIARTREALTTTERAARDTEARLAGVQEAKEQAADALVEAHERVDEIEVALELAQDGAGLDDEIAAADAAVRDTRARVMTLAGEAAALEREKKLRTDRLAAAEADRQRWAQRTEAAGRQVATLQERATQARTELSTLADLPAEIEAQRQRLITGIADADRERAAAADKLAAADTALREAQSGMRAAQAQVSTEREGRARIEAHLESARNRRTAEGQRIRETLNCEPDGCLALAQFPQGAALPALDEIERQLSRLKADRDRLGGVNLQADEELTQLDEQFAGMEKERADVEEAIAKLRGAIGQLNREGKKRIDDAFNAVNTHFQQLFATLFGGGEARLEMIESPEDPLEGGLEIIAKPPGKKPVTLSLLSGGEQTLTALSLIFAVFLTNPSPICVLDEVDAPLDDANVDRFATLMEKMAADTETRFLVITHHPMTMARMNRLFGVTMGEKGISQLVSVDLAAAERIVADDVPEQRAAG